MAANEVLKSTNTSAIYKYIGYLKVNGVIPSGVYLNSVSASSDLEKAELSNKCFHSVFKQSSFTMPLL